MTTSFLVHFGPHFGFQNRCKINKKSNQKNVQIFRFLRDAFCIDFEVKMLSKRGPWEMFFSEPLISWFLKDVLNKMLTFEAEMEPKIDAKTKKKLWKIEVAAKTAKILQNGWQKGSRKHPKSTNATCAWTPNKVFMRLGSLDTWAWVPRLGGESALFNRCFARSTCWQWVSRQV